jgi:hypothetical protein
LILLSRCIFGTFLWFVFVGGVELKHKGITFLDLFTAPTGNHLYFIFETVNLCRWEIGFETISFLHWMQNHPAIPIVACLLYGLLIVVGKKLMKNRPAFNWRNSMVRFCLS